MKLKLESNKKCLEMLKNNIEHHGKRNQTQQAIFELRELVEALEDYYLWKTKDTINIVDEIADVLIMIQQVVMIFDIENKVDDRIKFKLNRQQKRIKHYENNKHF